MRKFVQIALGTLVVAALSAPAAFANTITVRPDPDHHAVPGPTRGRTTVSLAGNSQISNGDFFTIFDFAGFVAGTQCALAGWSFNSATLGSCPAERCDCGLRGVSTTRPFRT